MTLEQVFRDEWGRVVASLIGFLGDFDLAEEAAQEAFALAAERWPRDGPPASPRAWLTTTARNRAIDRIRRDRTLAAKTRLLDVPEATEDEMDETTIPDERLELIFTCCHPALELDAQVALTLRTLGGLTTEEIARAFLVPQETMGKRLVRAKRTIAERRLPYEVPSAAELPARLAAVLAVVYLVFNEGYSASAGTLLQRVDLAREAIELGTLLAELLPDEPEVHGLMALMELQTSRSAARTDAAGEIVLLEDQDRGRWDRTRIARGLGWLARSRASDDAGPYRLQAEIAGCHATAASWAATDWHRIATLYAALAAVTPSPVVELNRAVAVAMADGPAAGLAIVDGLREVPSLRDYHLLPSTRADLLRRLGRFADARAEYERALSLTANRAQQAFIARRIAECDRALAGD